MSTIEPSLPFIVEAFPSLNDQGSNTMGVFNKINEGVKLSLEQIPIDVLKKQLSDVSSAFVNVLEEIQEIKSFQLSEVSIQVEVNGEGGVNFIGTSKLGGKGAITLKFTRKETAK